MLLFLSEICLERLFIELHLLSAINLDDSVRGASLSLSKICLSLDLILLPKFITYWLLFPWKEIPSFYMIKETSTLTEVTRTLRNYRTVQNSNVIFLPKNTSGTNNHDSRFRGILNWICTAQGLYSFCLLVNKIIFKLLWFYNQTWYAYVEMATKSATWTLDIISLYVIINYLNKQFDF